MVQQLVIMELLFNVLPVYLSLSVNGFSLTQYLGQISVSATCLNAALCSFFYNRTLITRRSRVKWAKPQQEEQRSKQPTQPTAANLPPQECDGDASRNEMAHENISHFTMVLVPPRTPPQGQ